MTLMRVLLVLAALAAAAYGFLMHTERGQDLLLGRGLAALGSGAQEPVDGIRVLVCGSAAPLPAVGRAQACLAVTTPSHFFVVDAGEGSANNLALAGLPMQRLDGILLTHFHSDHIASIPAINLGSWVAGRGEPLKVYGPPGVNRVVNGMNEAYALDRGYRTEHHGEDFMPLAAGRLDPVERPPDGSMTFGELTITSFAVDHGPVTPAVGYRFDYKGRSVVITGDTNITDTLTARARGADLLFTDALSLPIVQAMRQAALARGQERPAKILLDIQNYHASVADVAELAQTADVDTIALYHLVPAPRNALMENIFQREFTANMVLTRDRMSFTLPAGSASVEITRP